MTLEEFVNENYNAAILLFTSGRMGLLTQDPRLLSGEATALEATVALLEYRLRHKDYDDCNPNNRRRRDRAAGVVGQWSAWRCGRTGRSGRRNGTSCGSGAGSGPWASAA